MKSKDKVAAMKFLQTSVSELIDHTNEEQTRDVSKTFLQSLFSLFSQVKNLDNSNFINMYSNYYPIIKICRKFSVYKYYYLKIVLKNVCLNVF